MSEIDVVPPKITNNELNTPAEVLSHGCLQVLKFTLIDMLASNDFTADKVVPAFQERSKTIGNEAVREAISSEHYYYHSSDGPLAKFLGLESVDHHVPEVPQDLVPSRNFLKQFSKRLPEIADDFQQLGIYHRTLKNNTPYIELLSGVEACKSKYPDNSFEMWRSEAYDMVESATDEFDRFGLSEQNADAMMLVTFQGASRSITRRLLTGSTFQRVLRENAMRGRKITANDNKLLIATREYLRANLLVGNVWLDNPYHSMLDRKHVAKTVNYSAIAVDALGVIQKLNKNGNANYIERQYNNTKETLHRRIIDADYCNTSKAGNGYGRNFWQTIDVGHCFRGFDTKIDSVFSEYGIGEVRPNKDGTKAVIFEDDLEQMDEYRQLVGNFTTRTTCDKLCFSSPEGVIEAAQDSRNSLFILDIENFDDKNAGIQLAERVLVARRELVKKYGEKVPTTMVILWSLDKEALDRANDYFNSDGTNEKRIDTIGEDYISYFVGGVRKSTNKGRIDFKVCYKGWYPDIAGKAKK